MVASRSTPEPPSFAELFRQLAPFVWRALRRLGVAERDVEDVCQEVFVIVHRKLPGFDGRASVRTWVYGIALRVASDYRRSARVRREQVSADVPDEPISARQEAEVQLRQERAELDRALAELDDDKREVVVLFELEELPMADVAEAVGCPLQTAYSRLYAGRKQLESAVKRARGLPPGGAP